MTLRKTVTALGLFFYALILNTPSRCYSQDALYNLESQLQSQFSIISQSVVEIVVEALPDASSSHDGPSETPQDKVSTDDPLNTCRTEILDASPNAARRFGADRMGTGVVFGEEKYILTAETLVRNVRLGEDSRIRVTSGSTEALVDARVVGTDPVSGIAVLALVPKGREEEKLVDSLKSAELGKSSLMKPGSLVFMVCNPYGMENAAFWGLMSGRQHSLSCYLMDDYIQTNLPLHPGAVGAPVANKNGEVIGIMAAAFRQPPWQEVSFAIPTERFSGILPVLIEKGCVPRGYLGVSIMELTARSRERFGIPEDVSGVVVVDALPDSPAAVAGVVAGDVIQVVTGTPVSSVRELLWKIANASPNTEADLTVWRKGEKVGFRIVLGDSCKDSPANKASSP